MKQDFEGATRAGVYMHLSLLSSLTALRILGPIDLTADDPLIHEEIEQDRLDAFAELHVTPPPGGAVSGGGTDGSGSGSGLDRPSGHYPAQHVEPHLHFLLGLSGLRVLALTCISSGAGACLRHLVGLTRLEALLLDGRILLGNSGYAAMRSLSLPSLLSLQLPACTFEVVGPTTSEESGVVSLLASLPSSFPSLMNLEVGNCAGGLSRASLRSLLMAPGALPRLRYLTLNAQRSLSFSDCIEVVKEIGTGCALRYLESRPCSIHSDKKGLKVPSVSEEVCEGVTPWPPLAGRGRWADGDGHAARAPAVCSAAIADWQSSSPALPGDALFRMPTLPPETPSEYRKAVGAYEGFSVSFFGGQVWHCERET